MITTSKSSLGTKRQDVSLAGGIVTKEGANFNNDCVLYLGTGGDVNMTLIGEGGVYSVTKNLPQGVNLINVVGIDPTNTTAADIQLWF